MQLFYNKTLQLQVWISVHMTEDRINISIQINPNLKEQKYKYFSKSFRAELLFMEAVISNDQIEKTVKQECFPCFFVSDPNKDLIEELAQKYNPQFCLAFKIMKPYQRKIYYQQLSYLIRVLQDEVVDEFKQQAREHQARQQTQEYGNNLKQWMHLRVQKRLRNKMVKSILPENFKTAIMKNIMRESFELKLLIDGSSAQKMVKFDYFFMHLISKVKKNESKLILGMRNYILMASDQKRYTHRIQSIYPTIQPESLHLQFSNHQQKNMIINYLELVIKIGIVQNLIRNYAIEQRLKVAADQVASKQKNGVYSSMFDRSFSYDDLEDQDTESDDDISKMALYQSQTINLDLQKSKKLRQKVYNDMKKKLIETLKIIAEKKTKENERVNKLLNKHKKIGPKYKSKAIIDSLHHPQNQLVDLQNAGLIKLFEIGQEERKNSQVQNINQVPKVMKIDGNVDLNSKELLDEFENLEDENFSESQIEDSFLSKKNIEIQHYKTKEAKTIFKSTLKHEANIYSSVFYNNRKIQSDDNLTGYNRIMITKDIWITSQQKPQPTQQSIQLKEKAKNCGMLQQIDIGFISHKKIKQQTKTSENNLKTKDEPLQKYQSLQKMQKSLNLIKFYENINKECSLLQKNNKHSNFKIFIKQPLHLKYLISVVSDITTWHQWHPNISSVKLISQNLDQNICEFQFRCKVGNHQFQYKVKAHFFKVDDFYYLVLKILPKQENRQSVSFWNILNFWKKNQNVKLDYLLMKMHKSTNDGHSKLAIDFEIDQNSYNRNPKILNEQVTLFLNFYSAHEYWKTIKNKIEALPQNERRQTQIKIEKGKRLYNDSLFRIDWIVDNNVMQCKQHHWNKLNGQTL